MDDISFEDPIITKYFPELKIRNNNIISNYKYWCEKIDTQILSFENLNKRKTNMKKVIALKNLKNKIQEYYQLYRDKVAFEMYLKSIKL
jgi:hypothetical protein